MICLRMRNSKTKVNTEKNETRLDNASNKMEKNNKVNPRAFLWKFENYVQMPIKSKQKKNC